MKLLFISNIPSPYQIAWSNALLKKFDVEFWFFTSPEKSLSNRPSYWSTLLPPHCILHQSYFARFEFFFLFGFYSKLTAYNPDVINIGGNWFSYPNIIAYIWAKLNNKKIGFMPMEFSSHIFSFKKLIRDKFVYNFLYRFVDFYCANGFIHYDYLTNALSKKNVYLFFNFDDYSPYFKHPCRLETKVITFLYAGALEDRLNVHEMLDVFEKIDSSNTIKDFRLVIAGFGSLKSSLINRVSNSERLKSVVNFLDVSSWDEVESVYKKCDVLVNLASYSPAGGVVLSAVASGMGIITTYNVHASRYFIINGINGFMVEDYSDSAKYIYKYLNSDILVSHSKLNKEVGENLLGFDTHLRDYFSILESIGVI